MQGTEGREREAAYVKHLVFRWDGVFCCGSQREFRLPHRFGMAGTGRWVVTW